MGIEGNVGIKIKHINKCVEIKSYKKNIFFILI